MTTQNDPVTDKISARIRKLLALAANNPNVAEAESAAAEAQRLMLEYQISETTIEDKPASVVDGDMDSGEGKSRASMWKVYLASMISKHMSVRVFYTPGTDKIRVVGRGPDVAAASLLLLALVVGTPRPWGPEATGILHFVLGDLALYGLIALPGIFGWEWAWWPARLPWYFLRGNLAVAAPVLILAYSDYFAERWQTRKGAGK